MFPWKGVFAIIAVAYIVSLVYNLSDRPKVKGKRTIPGLVFNKEAIPQRIIDTTTARYSFTDPSFAYQILSELDIFEPVDEKHFSYRNTGSAYGTPFLGLKNDDEYCNKHRSYFAHNASSLFTKNFLLEADNKHIIRAKVCPPIGNDLHPLVSRHMPADLKENRTYDIEPGVNHFYTSTSLGVYKHVGMHFSCLTQQSNHILGVSTLNRKDYVAQAVNDYAKEFTDRPQCFSYDKFFPKTWILTDKQDCEAFFEIFNSEAYQQRKQEERIVYIRKVGAASHRGTGVQPVNDVEEAEIRQLWNNGTECGVQKKNYIIQHYIQNPLLLNGRKFDFRMYMLIASTEPLMAYYHDGFLRVTISEYDVNSDDKSVLMTNLALNNEVYDQVKNGTLYKGMDEETLKREQQWNFDRLHNYLFQTGVITDPNWLDNHLRPELKRAMVHLLRLATKKFLKNSSMYELFGVDFMLDTNLDLWFIEANSTPAFDGYSEPMEKFIVKMIQDHFEVVNSILKSRMKRIIMYVNSLVKDGTAQKTSEGGLLLQDAELRRQEFKNVVKNAMDEEFLPSGTNGFSKIYDGNYEGAEKYQGFISQDCL